MYMRHTKKNRKQRRNGKNKQRFSKKDGGFGGFLRGFQRTKDALKSGISSAATTVTDKFRNATSALQNTPIGKLNWDLKMRIRDTVTADTINGIKPAEYNKIQWQTNEEAISSDGLEALLQLAIKYANDNDDKKYITDVTTLKTLKASRLLDNNKVNNVNNAEIEVNNISKEIDRISKKYVLNTNPNDEDNIKDDIKELFKLILQKGNKTQLIDFSKNFEFFKDFNYEEKFKDDGTTPLLAAASNKSPEILNYILTDKEIKDNISFDKDSNNNTVLHIACTNNNPNILKVLFTKVNRQQGGIPWFTPKKTDNNVFKPNAIDDEIFNKITSLINHKNNANDLPIDIICKKPITKINGEAIKLLVDNGSKFFEANKLLSEKLKTLDNEINAINGEINKQTVKVSVKTNSLKKDISQKEVEKQKYQEVIKPITDKINSIKESEKENIIKIDANKQKALEIALKITNKQTNPPSTFVLDDFVEGSTIRSKPKTKSGFFDIKQYPTQDQLEYFKKESEAQLYLIPDKVIDKILELYPSQSDKERTIDSNYDNTITAIVETKPVQTNPETDLKDTEIETNETLPPLVQGGRRRVTKRLQHNLRRYKL